MNRNGRGRKFTRKSAPNRRGGSPYPLAAIIERNRKSNAGTHKERLPDQAGDRLYASFSTGTILSWIPAYQGNDGRGHDRHRRGGSPYPPAAVIERNRKSNAGTHKERLPDQAGDRLYASFSTGTILSWIPAYQGNDGRGHDRHRRGGSCARPQPSSLSKSDSKDVRYLPHLSVGVCVRFFMNRQQYSPNSNRAHTGSASSVWEKTSGGVSNMPTTNAETMM